jgi:DNA-binding transcriptional regulator YhcF (GntR family)
MEIVTEAAWRSRTPEELSSEWESSLVADGIWKNPGTKKREVLLFLARYHLQFEEVFPSQARIEEETGVSRSTIQRVVRDMERAGLQRRKLSRPKMCEATGRFISRETTRYQLCSRALRRGYRRKDHYRALQSTCRKRPTEQVSLSVNSDVSTFLSKVNIPSVVVEPVNELTQQPLTRLQARDIYERALLEGRAQREIARLRRT